MTIRMAPRAWHLAKAHEQLAAALRSAAEAADRIGELEHQQADEELANKRTARRGERQKPSRGVTHQAMLRDPHYCDAVIERMAARTPDDKGWLYRWKDVIAWLATQPGFEGIAEVQLGYTTEGLLRFHARHDLFRTAAGRANAAGAEAREPYLRHAEWHRRMQEAGLLEATV